MTKEIYRQLAQHLNEIPNGFPPTESGIELKLLAKIFTPEEAALAAVMRLTYEPAVDIAARAGVELGPARRLLKQMVRKGQILVYKKDKQLVFRLMPFAVGFYEEQLPRMDEELARLVEQYFQETQGVGLIGEAPPIHRVIPVAEAIPFDLELFTHERATELIENAKAWGVRDCICRVQQKLVGKGCDHPVQNCLSFAPFEGAFDGSHVSRAITKEEALDILNRAAEAGLVHSTGNYRDGHNYICNCCTCCCGVLRGVAEYGLPTAVAHSDFIAVVDPDTCIGCGDCIERCQFDALSIPEAVCVVEQARCVGCGVCTITCPSDALHLERRPEGETPLTPDNLRDWMAQRAKARGISLDSVL